jgi:predicted nucleic acid-binding protein
MAGTLVDSNVMLDVLTEDARRYAWSSTALAESANSGPLYINPIIGAHAAVAGLRLLTRDSRRYRTYFPSVEIIAPARQ